MPKEVIINEIEMLIRIQGDDLWTKMVEVVADLEGKEVVDSKPSKCDYSIYRIRM